mgnify:CR=1 FL=1
MTGIQLIAAERERLIGKWKTDDDQVNGELLECAIQVADNVWNDDDVAVAPFPPTGWPYDRANRIIGKYKDDHISRLVIAGALIAGEIDRLLRIKERA